MLDYFLIEMFLQGFNEVGQRTFPPTGTHAWKVYFSNNDYWQQVLRRNIHNRDIILLKYLHDHLVLKSPWKCVKFQVWGDGCSCLGWRTSKNVFPQFNIISFTIVYFATTILHRIAVIITININGDHLTECCNSTPTSFYFWPLSQFCETASVRVYLVTPKPKVNQAP